MNRKHNGITHLLFAGSAIVLFGLASAPAHAEVRYVITDLGSLGGRTFPMSINSGGQVTGYSYTGPKAPDHAFLWSPSAPNGTVGSIQDIGTPAATSSEAFGINDSGHITGWIPSGNQFHLMLFDSTIHDLGVGFGRAINNSGQIAGDTTVSGVDHAMIYDSSVHDIDTFGSTGSRAYGINNLGGAAGYVGVGSNFHAFLYDGTMHELGTLGGASSLGNAINDAGTVVGWSNISGANSNVEHAFLYDGAMHGLGTLGEPASVASDINEHGAVVGTSATIDGLISKAFLYTGGTGMFDLNTFIDASSGWALTSAASINDLGQIVGIGTIGGQARAFLLTPVPEPDSILLVGCATFTLIVSRRQSREFKAIPSHLSSRTKWRRSAIQVFELDQHRSRC
jgi:probable HAF family extracellular repeat protein